MKIRDLVFLIIGGLLVISGMVLNSVLVTDANADKGSIDTKFGKITCREIIIEDENGKKRGEIHIDNNKGCKIKGVPEGRKRDKKPNPCLIIPIIVTPKKIKIAIKNVTII